MENQNNYFENTQPQENSQTAQNTQNTSGVYYQNPPSYQTANQGQYNSYEAYSQANPYNAAPQNTDASKGFQIASLVLGIVSLVCCCCGLFSLIAAALGLVFGIIGLNKAKLSSSPSGMAIGGIITSAIGLVLTVVAWVMSAAFANSAYYEDFMAEFEQGFYEGFYEEYYDDYDFENFEDFDISFDN